MPKPREPWVVVNMTMDVHEIAEQTRVALAGLSDAAFVFATRMDELGFPVAVVISVNKDPR